MEGCCRLGVGKSQRANGMRVTLGSIRRGTGNASGKIKIRLWMNGFN